jgi:hypothetical protein
LGSLKVNQIKWKVLTADREIRICVQKFQCRSDFWILLVMEKLLVINAEHGDIQRLIEITGLSCNTICSIKIKVRRQVKLPPHNVVSFIK